ncbi:hypothetical protein HOF40_04120 [Candidatus Parcubacteria bacterium]|jgi:hypothetical protein|nr:hypothetical protein [Candidatus Parcubacteria bacterium]MBT3949248.1 hypothetical protein [Candidatus Parcubacteria bacterium]
MENGNEYASLMSDIIKKQSDILGGEIAVLKARGVSELTISDDGKVTEIEGEPGRALKKLIDEYIALSGDIVKNVMGPIFDKYPSIKVE